MANGIRTGDPRGFNKGCSSKFREGSRVRQRPEEGWGKYRPKRCENNNKDEDNIPKTLNDKNQASSLTFRQQTLFIVISRILFGGRSYPSAEKQLVYTTAIADRAIFKWCYWRNIL